MKALAQGSLYRLVVTDFMSRVGKKPISIPDKVSVEIKNSTIEIKGPGGTLTKTIPEALKVQVENKQVIVSQRPDGSEQTGNLYGLTRTLIANMIQGVVQPWKKDLEIQGVGYRASKAGQVLNLQLGYSHPIDFKVPDGIQFSVDAKQTFISLSGADKELLGIVADKIRSLRRPEPYKGKGIRYVGEHILRKAGKAAGAVGTAVGGKK